MVYTYSGKGDRQYPYYVCLNAQRKGWAACPAKSLSARRIEESVLQQVREAHPTMIDPSGWERMDLARQVETVRAIVEQVGYDGNSRQVTIRFHPPAIATPDGEVQV